MPLHTTVVFLGLHLQSQPFPSCNERVKNPRGTWKQQQLSESAWHVVWWADSKVLQIGEWRSYSSDAWQNKKLQVRNIKRHLEFSSEVSAACGGRADEMWHRFSSFCSWDAIELDCEIGFIERELETHRSEKDRCRLPMIFKTAKTVGRCRWQRQRGSRETWCLIYHPLAFIYAHHHL